MTIIRRELVPDARRVGCTARLFGLGFPRRLEPSVFAMAGRLSPDDAGGRWLFYALSNGGFSMAPDGDAIHDVLRERVRARTRWTWRRASTPTATSRSAVRAPSSRPARSTITCCVTTNNFVFPLLLLRAHTLSLPLRLIPVAELLRG
jgi:hypothetical protein